MSERRELVEDRRWSRDSQQVHGKLTAAVVAGGVDDPVAVRPQLGDHADLRRAGGQAHQHQVVTRIQDHLAGAVDQRHGGDVHQKLTDRAANEILLVRASMSVPLWTLTPPMLIVTGLGPTLELSLAGRPPGALGAGAGAGAFRGVGAFGCGPGS